MSSASLPTVAGFVDGTHLRRWSSSRDSCIAMLVGLLGAAYPAYRGARLLPTEAIRHE